MNNFHKKPTFFHALITIAFIVFMIFYGLLITKVSIHGVMQVCVFWCILNIFIIDQDLQRLKQSMTFGLSAAGKPAEFSMLIGWFWPF